jgi:N-acetylmuramoyl-L-alanine amidase
MPAMAEMILDQISTVSEKDITLRLQRNQNLMDQDKYEVILTRDLRRIANFRKELIKSIS